MCERTEILTWKITEYTYNVSIQCLEPKIWSSWAFSFVKNVSKMNAENVNIVCSENVLKTYPHQCTDWGSRSCIQKKFNSVWIKGPTMQIVHTDSFIVLSVLLHQFHHNEPQSSHIARWLISQYRITAFLFCFELHQ